MKRTGTQVGAAVAFTTVLALAGAANAQEPAAAEGSAGAGASMGGGMGASGGGSMTLPSAGGGGGGGGGGSTASTPAPGGSDHDQMVGTFAIGYLGRRSVIVGNSIAGGTQEVGAHIIGARYWLDEMIGIDAGIGLGIYGTGGSTQPVGGPSTDTPGTSATAFLLHGGVPLALANSGHFSFQVIPELNVGFGSSTQEIPAGTPPPAGDLKGSGFRFDIGARAGAEIHFGFIGIPQLSLQGSVGLAFAMNSTSFEDPATGKVKTSSTSFSTSVLDAPWNIFTSNVAALYYF